MALNANKVRVVASLCNAIEYSKKYGIFDVQKLHTFTVIDKYKDIIQNVSGFEDDFQSLDDAVTDIIYGGGGGGGDQRGDGGGFLGDDPGTGGGGFAGGGGGAGGSGGGGDDIVIDIKDPLPTPDEQEEAGDDLGDTGGAGTGGDGTGGSGGSGGAAVAPVMTAFTVTTTESAILFPDTTLYDVYQFSSTDILNNYSDNNDQAPVAFMIDRTDLANGGLLLYNNPGDLSDYTLYGEDASYLTVDIAEVENLYYYTNSTATNTHALSVKAVDLVGLTGLHSNIVTLTIDRTDIVSSTNLPATIGDQAIFVANSISTTLTLAMFTSGLTPPYNDPEGDLIDAIRIDEISTANQGTFQYNGADVVVGDIITREDLDAGLFVHIGANVNTIETDAINFSARDEGSGQWVN